MNSHTQSLLVRTMPMSTQPSHKLSLVLLTTQVGGVDKITSLLVRQTIRSATRASTSPSFITPPKLEVSNTSHQFRLTSPFHSRASHLMKAPSTSSGVTEAKSSGSSRAKRARSKLHSNYLKPKMMSHRNTKSKIAPFSTR